MTNPADDTDDDPAMVRFWTDMTHEELTRTLELGQRIARRRCEDIMRLVSLSTGASVFTGETKAVLGRPRKGSNTPFPDNTLNAPRGALDGGEQ